MGKHLQVEGCEERGYIDFTEFGQLLNLIIAAIMRLKCPSLGLHCLTK